MVDILSSVGDKFADEAISVVKKTFDKLVESNKISDSRGASIFENIKNGIFDKSQDFEKTVCELIRKMYEKMDIATPEEISALKRRVTILEKLTRL